MKYFLLCPVCVTWSLKAQRDDGSYSSCTGRNAVIRGEEGDRCLLDVRTALFFVMGSTRGKGLAGELVTYLSLVG